MYLSQAYMRNKTTGQKACLYLLSLIDAYRNNDSDLSTTVGALKNQLRSITTIWPQLTEKTSFKHLFEIDNSEELMVKPEHLGDLCRDLMRRND